MMNVPCARVTGASLVAALTAPLTRTFLSLSPDCAKALALVEKL